VGRGNLLDVLEAALALTLVFVGSGLARLAFTGTRLGRAWIVRAGLPFLPVEPEESAGLPPAAPQWFHRVYTFSMGALLAALGLFVLALILL
jgi:hypothetical protein